jgi:hypothetical protein
MALTNCTISSSATVSGKTGGAILGTTTATLTITPSTNFVVTASAFTNNTAENVAIQNIAFSDTTSGGAVGNTVLVTITFNPGYTMPSANQSFVIDIDGAATERSYTIAGTYSTTSTNVSESDNTNTAYSQTYQDDGRGGFSIATLFTKVLTPSTNFSFANNEPTYSITSSYPELYSVSISGSGSGARTVVVTFKATTGIDISGDKIDITAHPLPSDPTLSSVITAYKIERKAISIKGETRKLYIYGRGNYDLTVAHDQETGTYGTGVLNSGATTIKTLTNQTIDSTTGVDEISIDFPEATTDETFVFTITPNSTTTATSIADSIKTNHNSAVFTVEQKKDVVFSFTASGTSYSSIAVTANGGAASATGTVTGQYNTTTPTSRDGTQGTPFNFTWTVSHASAVLDAFMQADGSSNFFTNLTANGWIIVVDSVTYGNLGSRTAVTFAVAGRILGYGTADTTSVFDLDVPIERGQTRSDANMTAYVIATDANSSSNYITATAADLTKGGSVSTVYHRTHTIDSVQTGEYVYKFYHKASTDTYNVSAGAPSTLTNNNYYKYKKGTTSDSNQPFMAKWTTGGVVTDRNKTS